MSAPVDLKALEAHVAKMAAVHAALGGGQQNEEMSILIAALREMHAALRKIENDLNAVGAIPSLDGAACAKSALARVAALVRIE